MDTKIMAANADDGKLVRSTAFIVLLAVLSALGQFASNVYLPSLPAVSAELGISSSATALTYTIYLAAFAFAQLVYGPLADRFGRRPLVLLGTILFVLGSVICAMSSDLSGLLVGRVIQAIGASAGVVMARAMVRDVFSGADLAKALALMTIVFAMAPGFSPLIGGILQDTMGWRTVFSAAAIVGVLVFAAAATNAPETLAVRSKELSLAVAGRTYRAILKDAQFVRYAMATAFVIGAMSAFFVGSPTVFIDLLGVSATEYGFYPPLAITGFVIGGVVTRKFAGRVPVHRLALIGVGISLVGALFMMGFPLSGIEHKHAINASIVVFVSGMGVSMPTAVAIALDRFPNSAGSAAAILGFMQMGIGAVSSALTGMLAVHLPFLAFPAVMLIANIIALTLVTTAAAETTE